MLLNDINARIGEVDAELETLAALTDPTDDDVARTEALEAEVEELRKARIQAKERVEKISAAHQRAREQGREIKGASFEIQKTVDPFDVDFRYMDPVQQRDAARAILDRPEARHLAADQKDYDPTDDALATPDARSPPLGRRRSRSEWRSCQAGPECSRPAL